MKYLFFTLATTLLIFLFQNCHRKRQAQDPSVWNKIKIDFKSIDNDGLSGPPNGKVSINYEFCIPNEPLYWREVSKIDPSAQKSQGKGRVGCGTGTSLVIGSTHQKNYKKILYDLASLKYVNEIQQTFWE
jgi:hypothetical protein